MLSVTSCSLAHRVKELAQGCPARSGRAGIWIQMSRDRDPSLIGKSVSGKALQLAKYQLVGGLSSQGWHSQGGILTHGFSHTRAAWAPHHEQHRAQWPTVEAPWAAGRHHIPPWATGNTGGNDECKDAEIGGSWAGVSVWRKLPIEDIEGTPADLESYAGGVPSPSPQPTPSRGLHFVGFSVGALQSVFFQGKRGGSWSPRSAA